MLVALVAGSCCYAGVAALVLQTGSVPLVPPDAGGASVDSPVATHAWGSLVQLQLLFGLSRAAWESVGVALTVEWFGMDDVQLSAAFAARLLFDGLGVPPASFYCRASQPPSPRTSSPPWPPWALSVSSGPPHSRQ